MAPCTVIHPITRLILGGAQQNTMETCAGLDRSRFTPEIVCGPETGSEGELITEVRRRGIPLHIMPGIVRRPHPPKDMQAYRALSAYFKERRPQIVHTHSSKTGILGRWAARRARVPVIVHTVHGWGHHPRQNVFIRRLYILLERLSARITDRLIVVSRLNADKGLRDAIGAADQYVTIHSSINLDEFAPGGVDTDELRRSLGLEPGRLVVGTVGRLSPQKNPLDFVRVAAEVRARMPDVQFVFVGDGPLRARTEALIRELGLERSVVLAGLRRDVAQLLQCMDIFIMTSLWEGLPRVIPQAMAVGLPVVANRVDGVAEVIREGANGFGVAPGDISSLAERIIWLAHDEKRRQSMGMAGQTIARAEFSLTKMVAMVEALYSELLTAKGVPADTAV
jgi:glycosyltransferase involved in cell wall biosynthesis